MSCFTVEKQSGTGFVSVLFENMITHGLIMQHLILFVDELKNVCYKKIIAKQYISEAGVSPALCLSNRVAYEGTCKFAATEA